MKHLCGAPLRNKKVHYYTHPLAPCYSERVNDEAFFKDAWCSGSQHALISIFAFCMRLYASTRVSYGVTLIRLHHQRRSSRFSSMHSVSLIVYPLSSHILFEYACRGRAHLLPRIYTAREFGSKTELA